MKKINLIIFLVILFAFPGQILAASPYSGKIFLQVESNGEAWYIYPVNNQRYYLGRPADAYGIMRELGLGITTKDLNTIPIGYITNTHYLDSDNDGLPNNLENAIGTDPNNPDTDGDDYSDSMEIKNKKNPIGPGATTINYSLINRLKGRILLQVDKNGEAWYLNPLDSKRYYLGDAQFAFDVMRTLGQGITNANLSNIPNRYIKTKYIDENNYEIAYPTDWLRTDNSKAKSTYLSMNVLSDNIFNAGNANTLEVIVLESEANHTLGSFKKSNMTKTENIQIGIKPGLEQTKKFESITTVDDITYNKGEYFNVYIMISTNKFIYLHYTIPNGSEIPLYENIFEQILRDFKPKDNG